MAAGISAMRVGHDCRYLASGRVALSARKRGPGRHDCVPARLPPKNGSVDVDGKARAPAHVFGHRAVGDRPDPPHFARRNWHRHRPSGRGPGRGHPRTRGPEAAQLSACIFTATAISMGEVLLRTDALNSMTTVLFAWMRPWITNAFSIAFVPYWTAFVYHIFL